MKQESFKILQNTKKLVLDLSEFSKNFPKNEVIFKTNLQEELFALVRYLNCYTLNKDTRRIQEKYLKDFIVSLSMVDYYLEYAYQRKMISFQKYKSLTDMLIEIRKMSYGVLKNEKK